MPRIRTVKPELLRHEGLQELQAGTKLPVMLTFIGLFTQADREGRFKWAPKQLKLDILPFLSFDLEATLNGLAGGGFIHRYTVEGKEYGVIPSWAEHQFINIKEPASKIPAPTGIFKTIPEYGEGKGREGEMERELEGKGNEPDGSASPESFLDAWNRERGSLPRVQEFTGSRKKKVQARIRQGLTVEKFEQAVKTCTTMPFLLGNNQRGWVASFDWLIENDTNIAKVLEGKYASVPGGSNGNRAQQRTNGNLEALRIAEQWDQEAARDPGRSPSGGSESRNSARVLDGTSAVPRAGREDGRKETVAAQEKGRRDGIPGSGDDE